MRKVGNCAFVAVKTTVTGLFATAALAQSIDQYLPQVADGTGWLTTIIVVNQAPKPVNVTIDLFAPNGSPLNVLFTGSSAALVLPVGGSALVQSTGPLNPTLKAGYARVRSSDVVGAAAVFQFFDSNGALVSEAGVLPAPVVREFSIPASYHRGQGVNTGLAIASPLGPARLNLALQDGDGVVRASSTLDLAAGGHTALFLDQTAPPLFAGGTPILGSIKITSDVPVAPVTLRFDGAELTTIPVILPTLEAPGPPGPQGPAGSLAVGTLVSGNTDTFILGLGNSGPGRAIDLVTSTGSAIRVSNTSISSPTLSAINSAAGTAVAIYREASRSDNTGTAASFLNRSGLDTARAVEATIGPGTAVRASTSNGVGLQATAGNGRAVVAASSGPRPTVEVEASGDGSGVGLSVLASSMTNSGAAATFRNASTDPLSRGIEASSAGGPAILASNSSSSATVQISTAGAGPGISVLVLPGQGNRIMQGSRLVGLGTSRVFSVENTGEVRSDVGFNSPADFAEAMEVDGGRDDFEPGDVVVVCIHGRRGVDLAAEPYSTRVAGIYSTKPGITGSEHPMEGLLEHEIPVAVVGIVPCKVSAENGAIAAGDLLTTCSTPGHAMKVTDRARATGAVVGKALEPLASGTGLIRVLVSLQ